MSAKLGQCHALLCQVLARSALGQCYAPSVVLLPLTASAAHAKDDSLIHRHLGVASTVFSCPMPPVEKPYLDSSACGFGRAVSCLRSILMLPIVGHIVALR